MKTVIQSSIDTDKQNLRSSKAVELRFRVLASMPLHGGAIGLMTKPRRLTRERNELKTSRLQLMEILDWSARAMPSSPRLQVLGPQGQVLRETPLIERPRDTAPREDVHDFIGATGLPAGGYIVGEVKPGGAAGTVDEWLVNVVRDYGRKKSV